MARGLTIELLPARHGDAIWIEWGTRSKRRRILIDGGPEQTFELVRDRFLGLDPTDRHVDLLVVTHVDLDHIDGAIRLLRDSSIGVTYGDIWFNDYHHLNEVAPRRGPLQGEFLGALLADAQLPWNVAFRGGPIVVPEDGPLPSVKLSGGIRLVLLSPTLPKLVELRDEWDKVLAKAKMEPGDRDEALERMEARLGPATRGGDRTSFGGDGSEANGSSIAFVLESGRERWLFAGDAHDDVLLAGLRRYGEEIGRDPVPLDGFKLAHHGSVNNITPELLDAIDCRRFLVSTSGAYFKHPDEACIDLIVSRVDRPELVFNYRSEFTAKWAEPSSEYHAIFPEAEGDEPLPTAARGDGKPVAPSPSGSTTATGTTVADDSADDGADDVPEGVEVTEPTGPAPVPASADPAPDGSPSPPGWSAADEDDDDDDELDEQGRPARGELHVSVTHGSLELAVDPVMVGHYVATSLSGTESFVDHRFQRRLSDRLATGQYPGAIGTSLHVMPPRQRHPMAGVIVVGLGEYGELTPLRLVETVRAALVARALDEVEADHVGTVAELGIATVLLGATGDQGLTVAGSVRALVSGVIEANRTLRRLPGPRYAVYRRIAIWERYEAAAELTFRTVRALGEDVSELVGAEDDELVTAPDLRVAGGALENSPVVDTADAAWWRLRVTDARPEGADGADADDAPFLELDFAVGGRMARTGVVRHQVERRRITRLVSGAVGQPEPGAGVHTTLFELLFPNQLKWDLMGAQDIQIELDDTTADIPWEMLAARNPEHGDRGPLALRAPMIRQLRSPDLPEVRRSTRPAALVIGNPPVGPGAGLPGAYGEAKTVAHALGTSGYDVTALCYPEGEPADDAVTQIEHALFGGDYRIVHIAAHGQFRPDEPTRSGVMIGPDDYLTAQVLRQLNVIPDLVFLNCCHLAAVGTGIENDEIDFTRRNLNRLGASLARQLIHSGVRAVVVAGWAVDDNAAVAFARRFYARLLRGRPFGEAVHSARRAAYESPNSHATWGAYQCYGDAGYRLPRDVLQATARSKIPAPATVREAIRRVERLMSRIEFIGVEVGGGVEYDRAEAELRLIIETATNCGWFTSKELMRARLAQRLREALADAWAALGDHERAVEWYDAGIQSDDSGLTLRAIEQLCNHQDRFATRLLRTPDVGDDDRKRADGLLQSSMRLIEILEQLSGSGERSALRAGHHKRRAAALRGEERAVALRAAASAYLNAHEHAPDEPYPLLNYLQLEYIRSQVDGDTADVARFELDLVKIVLDSTETRAGDYWEAVARADSELTCALVEGTLVPRIDVLAGLYANAFDARSTGSQRASTLDHLLDLGELHPDEAQSDALFELRDRLRALGVSSGPNRPDHDLDVDDQR